jgi:hypothetical protein
MSGSISKRFITTILIGAGLGAAVPARADVSAAARAFADGQSALLENNYERAAQSFELAYNIAPSKEALRSAVRARQLHGQLPRAATLAHVLLTRFGDDPVSTQLANEVIDEAKRKLGRIAITCAPRCTLAIGGRATSFDAAPSHVVFTVPGRVGLEITFDGDRSVTREVTVKVGDELALPIAAPPMPAVADKPSPRPAAEPPDDRPLSPYIALGGAALTLALAGVTTWSALDTVKAHDAYVAAPSDAGWQNGRSKQLRTNLLLGGTIAAAVGTAVVSVIWTRWRGSDSESPALAVTPGSDGLTVAFGHRF